MSPLVRAALVIAILSGVSRAAETRAAATPTPIGLSSPKVTNTDELASACPPGTLPDANVCIPVPSDVSDGQELSAESNAHRERSGRWRVYDQIPRRPDRPADYRRYRFPVLPPANQSLVMSGYDLHLPDAAQRRGPELSAVGHGGIDIAQKRGTEVRLVNLEHQASDAEVLHVGPLFGNSVVTRHTVREAGRLQEYIVIHGHLDGPAPGLHRGSALAEGALVGFVGDSGSPGAVHLHLEVRKVRADIDIAKVSPGELTQNARTVVCDPRNVLPLVSP